MTRISGKRSTNCSIVPGHIAGRMTGTGGVAIHLERKDIHDIAIETFTNVQSGQIVRQWGTSGHGWCGDLEWIRDALARRTPRSKD